MRNILFITICFLVASFVNAAPAIEVTPSSYDFGNVLVGTTADKIFDVNNVGDSYVMITAIEFRQGSNPDFSLGMAPLLPMTFAPGVHFEVEVLFSPSDSNEMSAILDIFSSEDPNVPVAEVPLSGKGDIIKEVAFDIKPTSCPSPVNTKSQGVLPVAILGSDVFDVNQIDTGSLYLEGVAPIRCSYEDVSTPIGDPNQIDPNDTDYYYYFDDDPNSCICSRKGPDGFMDLTLKFDTQEVLAAIGDVNDSEVWELFISGMLHDETLIEGSDCIIIRKKPEKEKKKEKIVWCQSSKGSHFTSEMTDTTPALYHYVGGNPDLLVVGKGDFNGDGEKDLLWCQTSTGAYFVSSIDNSVPGDYIGGSLAWEVVSIGDFDGDGRCDLIWRQISSGAHFVWLMNGPNMLSGAHIGGSLDWEVVSTGDFDGDGRCDLIWRQISSGANFRWLMGGLIRLSGDYIGGSLDWEVISMD